MSKMNQDQKPAPIPMRLPCPGCGQLHIDAGDFATKLHHTHSCQHCGLTWRPAVVATVGVRFLPGFLNEQHAEPEMLSEQVSPHVVTYTLRCRGCKNSSTHPLPPVRSYVASEDMMRQFQLYAEHHAKCAATPEPAPE